MNIIYCRKQAQAAVEYINTNNPHLTEGVNFKEVCTHVEKSWWDESLRSYKGMYFHFQEAPEQNIFCNIYVAPRFYSEEDQPMTFMFHPEMEKVNQGETLGLN